MLLLLPHLLTSPLPVTYMHIRGSTKPCVPSLVELILRLKSCVLSCPRGPFLLKKVAPSTAKQSRPGSCAVVSKRSEKERGRLGQRHPAAEQGLLCGVWGLVSAWMCSDLGSPGCQAETEAGPSSPEGGRKLQRVGPSLKEGPSCVPAEGSIHAWVLRETWHFTCLG